MDGCSSTISEIIPNSLYIAGREVTREIKSLVNSGFTSILNCASGDFQVELDVLELLELPIQDTSETNANIEIYVSEACAFLHRTLSKPQKPQTEKNTETTLTEILDHKAPKVLVVCESGVSRSVSVVVAYLVRTYSTIFLLISIHRAYFEILFARSCAFPFLP